MSITATPQQRLALQAARVKLLEARSRKSDIQKAGDVITISGTAVIWDRLTDYDAPGQIPSCLTKGSIDELTYKFDDIPLVINHDPSTAIASTGAGTLRLMVTGHSLHWFADIPASPAGRRLVKDIESGRLAGSSIKYRGRGGTVKRDGESVQEVVVVDEITDISIVSKACDSRCTTSVLGDSEDMAKRERESLRKSMEILHRYRDDSEYRAAFDQHNPEGPISDTQWQQEHDYIVAKLSGEPSQESAPVERPARSRRPKPNRKLFPNGEQHLIGLNKIMNNPYMTAMARQNGMTTRQLASAAMAGPVGHAQLSGSCMWEPDETEECGWRYLGPT